MLAPWMTMAKGPAQPLGEAARSRYMGPGRGQEYQ